MEARICYALLYSASRLRAPVTHPYDKQNPFNVRTNSTYDTTQTLNITSLTELQSNTNL
jgi:hypothetical protein